MGPANEILPITTQRVGTPIMNICLYDLKSHEVLDSKCPQVDGVYIVKRVCRARVIPFVQVNEDPQDVLWLRACTSRTSYLSSPHCVLASTKITKGISNWRPAENPDERLRVKVLPKWLIEEFSFTVFRHLGLYLKRFNPIVRSVFNRRKVQ